VIVAEPAPLGFAWLSGREFEEASFHGPRAATAVAVAAVAAGAGRSALAARRSAKRYPRSVLQARQRRYRSRGFGESPSSSAEVVNHPEEASESAQGSGGLSVEDCENAVDSALETHWDSMCAGLRKHGWWASEASVLPDQLCDDLRGEVEQLWTEGWFKKSQSVRGGDYYDKENVYATELDGGKYSVSPRLIHYTVRATREIAARVRKAFPELQLSDAFIGNKLNLCVGNGAHFDAHLDVGVAEKPFNRKLTVLLYLNKAWREELGGKITLLGEGRNEEEVALDSGAAASGLPASLAPLSGRWVAFWADRMLHRVEDSIAPAGLEEYRVSYTIWLCTEESEESEAEPSVSPPASGDFEVAPF